MHIGQSPSDEPCGRAVEWDRSAAIRRFTEIAQELGVPAELAGVAGRRCYESEVKRFAEMAREQDWGLRRRGLEVPVRPVPEIELRQWFGKCSEAVRDEQIRNNVRLYVRLYVERRIRLDESDAEEMASYGLESTPDSDDNSPSP
jgi:hypothetical protein